MDTSYDYFPHSTFPNIISNDFSKQFICRMWDNKGLRKSYCDFLFIFFHSFQWFPCPKNKRKIKQNKIKPEKKANNNTRKCEMKCISMNLIVNTLSGRDFKQRP